MKALVDTFNQERALVGAFSVIVKSSRICLPFVSSSTGNKETVVRVLALADGGGVGGWRDGGDSRQGDICHTLTLAIAEPGNSAVIFKRFSEKASIKETPISNILFLGVKALVYIVFHESLLTPGNNTTWALCSSRPAAGRVAVTRV